MTRRSVRITSVVDGSDRLEGIDRRSQSDHPATDGVDAFAYDAADRPDATTLPDGVVEDSYEQASTMNEPETRDGTTRSSNRNVVALQDEQSTGAR
jgi:hypothetical protein